MAHVIVIYGIPEVLVSDNGPPFNSKIYQDFCLSNGINSVLTPPNHQKSNGLAERQVRIIKNNLNKQLMENFNKNIKDTLQCQIDRFLFCQRNIPCVSTGCSPSDFMLKRKPRTRLTLLKPGYIKESHKKNEEIQQG